MSRNTPGPWYKFRRTRRVIFGCMGSRGEADLTFVDLYQKATTDMVQNEMHGGVVSRTPSQAPGLGRSSVFEDEPPMMYSTDINSPGWVAEESGGIRAPCRPSSDGTLGLQGPRPTDTPENMSHLLPLIDSEAKMLAHVVDKVNSPIEFRFRTGSITNEMYITLVVEDWLTGGEKEYPVDARLFASFGSITDSGAQPLMPQDRSPEGCVAFWRELEAKPIRMNLAEKTVSLAISQGIGEVANSTSAPPSTVVGVGVMVMKSSSMYESLE